MTAYSGFVAPESDARRYFPAKLAWLSDGVVIESRLGTTETTAIGYPRAFTAARWALPWRTVPNCVTGELPASFGLRMDRA